MNTEDLVKNIRAVRDQLLKDCDWTQLSDAPLTEEKKAEWASYRQLLRDLPQAQSITELQDTSDVIWPVKPA